MFDLPCRRYYWRKTAADVHCTVKSYTDCPRMETKFSHQLRVELFPASGSLDVISIDILGLLSRTRSGNQFLVIITHRYSKLTKVISITKVTWAQVPNIFSTTGLSFTASWTQSFPITESNPLANFSHPCVYM